MSMRKMRELAPGFTSEIDTVSDQMWWQLLQKFADANIYQTWSYASVISGRRNMSHLVLKYNGEVVAIAQARIARLPFIKLGIAYIQWGPLWRRSGTETVVETFAQAIRALRNEFVCKRGLTLRVFPLVFGDDSSRFSEMLKQEGFSLMGRGTRGRTILMDLSPPLEDLREGMRAHWKREVKVAEKKELEIIEGSSREMFDLFIGIYKEMVSRKKFIEPNDINQFRVIQAQLPEQFKMKIMLCRSGEGISSGLICSAIGDTAIYLFGATSNAGMRTRGSYFLQWKLIEQLKREGIAVYNLNGINPTKNPGTYKFKDDLAGKNGRDVYSLGRFDSHGSLLGRTCVEFGDTLRARYQSLEEYAKTVGKKSAAKRVAEDLNARALDGAPRSSQVLRPVPRNEA